MKNATAKITSVALAALIAALPMTAMADDDQPLLTNLDLVQSDDNQPAGSFSDSDGQPAASTSTGGNSSNGNSVAGLDD